MPRSVIAALFSQIILPIAAAQLPPVPEMSRVPSEAKPKLYVAERLIELGDMLEGDTPTVTWLLENRGQADLVIERVRPTCGCTIVKLDDADKIVPPDGSLPLRVEFDSTGRYGPQHKSITVYSNDPAEPTLKLTFRANVDFLFRVKPPGLVNLRAVRRGQMAPGTIDIVPGPGRKVVEILEMSLTEGESLILTHEPFDAQHGRGQRIHIAIDRDAAIGTASAKLSLKLSIDGVERNREVTLRAAVVGDLTWHPVVVDNTRRPSPHGQRLAPVVIRSTDKTPFKVISADAGSLFDVSVEEKKGARRGSKVSIFLSVRDDAPPGPFGTMLTIRTDSLDEPVIRVPVFGTVAARVQAIPPVVALRQDGTPRGTRRRIKVQAPPSRQLELYDIRCDNEAVSVTIDREASARYRHIRFLEVRLIGELPEGRHEATLTLRTSVEGAEQLEIPVTILVPPSGG